MVRIILVQSNLEMLIIKLERRGVSEFNNGVTVYLDDIFLIFRQSGKSQRIIKLSNRKIWKGGVIWAQPIMEGGQMFGHIINQEGIKTKLVKKTLKCVKILEVSLVFAIISDAS